MRLVSTSHQKVVLEIDFSGTLWVGALTFLEAAMSDSFNVGLHGDDDHTHQQRAQDSESALQAMQYVCFISFSTAITQPAPAIHSVTVAGHSAEFTVQDPLSNITLGGTSEAQDCHRHAELKRKLYSAMQECDEGELSIAIPKEVTLKPAGQSSQSLAREGMYYALSDASLLPN